MSAPDGIETLIGDHRRCISLFQQIDGVAEPDATLIRRIIRELSIHDAIESQLFYPLVERRLSDGNRLALETLAEHAQMAQQLAEVDRRRPGDPHRRALLADLAGESRRHFATEEEILLGPLQELMAPEELARLDIDLAQARKKAPTRAHPHSPRFTVGAHAAAAVLRPIDRLRDVLRPRP